jgi:hypothetical protein
MYTPNDLEQPNMTNMTLSQSATSSGRMVYPLEFACAIWNGLLNLGAHRFPIPVPNTLQKEY